MPVSDKATKQPGPFDVRTVQALAALMTEHDLSEIDLRDGSQRLHLRRGGAAALPAAPAPTPMSAPAAPAPAAHGGPPASAPAPAAAGRKLLEIKSETVGTFYTRPKPGAPTFVQVGSRVKPDTVVCIIDVMKTMNAIPAGCSGSIAEILIEDGAYVEFGQVLFRVDPAG